MYQRCCVFCLKSPNKPKIQTGSIPDSSEAPGGIPPPVQKQAVGLRFCGVAKWRSCELLRWRRRPADLWRRRGRNGASRVLGDPQVESISRLSQVSCPSGSLAFAASLDPPASRRVWIAVSVSNMKAEQWRLPAPAVITAVVRTTVLSALRWEQNSVYLQQRADRTTSETNVSRIGG